MKGLSKLFGDFFDSAFGHLLVLSFAIGALFLVYKATASYLPNGGVGGAIKKSINAI